MITNKVKYEVVTTPESLEINIKQNCLLYDNQKYLLFDTNELDTNTIEEEYIISNLAQLLGEVNCIFAEITALIDLYHEIKSERVKKNNERRNNK